MFEKEDFFVDSWPEFFGFLLIVPFVALVFPVISAVWALGVVEDMLGWLDT